MSAPAYPAAHHPFTTPHRRQAAILLLIAVAIARSAPLRHVKDLIDVVLLKQWRAERRARREETKRRESETPL